MAVHGTVQTPNFLADAKAAGVSEYELEDIVSTIAANPETGDLIPGTGGARKLRFPGRGKGKSGGYRIITYFCGVDAPVFLLALISKGRRADLTQAERNDLRIALAGLADDYRAGVRAKTGLREALGKRS
jgi:hypothetical protein